MSATPPIVPQAEVANGHIIPVEPPKSLPLIPESEAPKVKQIEIPTGVNKSNGDVQPDAVKISIPIKVPTENHNIITPAPVPIKPSSPSPVKVDKPSPVKPQVTKGPVVSSAPTAPKPSIESPTNGPSASTVVASAAPVSIAPKPASDVPKTNGKSPRKIFKKKRAAAADVANDDEDSSEGRVSKRVRLQHQPFQSPSLKPSFFKAPFYTQAKSSSGSDENKIVVFNKGDFLAVRNDTGSFYVCRTAQNVYKSSRRFKIQWLNDDKDVYTPDFFDQTDFECVLTNLRMTRISKGRFRLSGDEKKRAQNILQRALNVERGVDQVPDPLMVAADGIDVSVVGKKEEEEVVLKTLKESVRKKPKSHQAKSSSAPDSDQKKSPAAVIEKKSGSKVLKEPEVKKSRKSSVDTSSRESSSGKEKKGLKDDKKKKIKEKILQSSPKEDKYQNKNRKQLKDEKVSKRSADVKKKVSKESKKQAIQQQKSVKVSKKESIKSSNHKKVLKHQEEDKIRSKKTLRSSASSSRASATVTSPPLSTKTKELIKMASSGLKSTVKRGVMIVFEGADRVGKSTHASKCLDALKTNGHPVELIKFPNRESPTGVLIDSYLKGQQKLDDHSIHLLFSANRWELFQDMKRKLESGKNLIIDRYVYSGIAYSAAKSSMGIEWCKSSDSGLIKPDAVIYMTASDDVMINRPGFGDEIYESKEFQSRVKRNYNKLKDDSWSTVNSDVSMDALHVNLMKIINETIEKSCHNPIQYLWTK